MRRQNFKKKIVYSSRISSLATSDSFPTSEQSSQNSKESEEKLFNSTEVHEESVLKSDNDQALHSDVLKDLASEQIVEELLVESRTKGAGNGDVIERIELDKEKVNENIEPNGIAEAVLLDSISTNSGING